MSRPNVEIYPLPFVQWRRKTTDDTVTTGVFTGDLFDRYSWKRAYTGSVTPSYRVMSRRGKLKLSTLDHSVTYQTDSGTSYTERQELGTGLNPDVQLTAEYSLTSAAIVGSCPSATHLAEAYTKARAQLAEKVNNLSLNVAQAFAERKQTAGLLARNAQRVAWAALALRHGRLGDLASALQIRPVSPVLARKIWKTHPDVRLENFWLEFVYGWKPLLQDAFGAAELLASHIADDRYNIGCTSRGFHKKITTVDKVNPLDVQVIQKETTSCRMSLTYRMDSEARAALSRTGISNPALLAWELLPYSFVIDWFIPVGNYLQALDAFKGFEFVDGWLAQKSELWRENSVNGSEKTWNGNIWTITKIQWGSTHYRASYTRVKLDGFPPVGPLSMKNGVGGEPAARFATAMSLLVNAFRKYR